MLFLWRRFDILLENKQLVNNLLKTMDTSSTVITRVYNVTKTPRHTH